MGLSDIAEGIAVTERQRERGVATVDRTDPTVNAAIAPFEDDLPCDVADAAILVDEFVGGASVGAAAASAGLPAVTGAKTLFLLGFEGLSPLSPLGREILGDWLAGDIGRTDAKALTDASDAEFALATFLETHDPLPDADERIATALQSDTNHSVAKRDVLADTMSGVGDLR
ncbi:MAG: hypothetical protein ACQEQY_05300 [Halobacteriota archaeon]